MENKNFYDVIVIGGGPGGYGAALYTSRANLTTLVVEKFAPGGQMGTTEIVENYPGFTEGINGFELGMQMKQGAERFGVETKIAEVQSVDLEKQPKVIVTSDGTYEAKTVILAMGAYPRELGLPNERELRGRGVSYCATCDGAFFRNKVTAVIGGGDVAVEDAIFLARMCSKVYLIHRRNELRAAKSLQESLFAQENVEILWDTVADSIEGEGSVECLKITNVKTGEKSELALQGVFIAVGISPESRAFEGLVDMDHGYIKAGEDGVTSVPGIFAAGDVRTKLLRQIVTAAADGANAVTSAERYLTAH